ncbi:MAG: hypothetical protein JXR95_10860 [Deltaproteobacteria bacterium]|nr:hypothetical protein [Deltaproteobacteria bacterium]
MKRFMLIGSLLLSMFVISCEDTSDAVITCDNYDAWLSSCDNCSVSVACEDNYLDLPVDIQMDLDECSDIIVSAGCADWSTTVQECVDLGVDYLGVVCTVDPYCGDGTCDTDEDEETCPADCVVASYCGDETCDTDEDEINCAEDCGYIVCDYYADWLEGCYDDCTTATTCLDEYASYAEDEVLLEDLSFCAEALSVEALELTCNDIYVTGTTDSCDYLLEENLGSAGTCTFK